MVKRRSGLGFLSTLFAALGFPDLGYAAKWSQADEASPSIWPPRGASGRSWISPANAYFGYPHTNSFVPETGNPVIAQRQPPFVNLQEWDFRSGGLRPLLRTDIGNMYWDIAEETGDLFVIDQKRRIISVATGAGRTSPPPFEVDLSSSQRMGDLLSVSRTGGKVLYELETLRPDKTGVQSARVMELEINIHSVTPICDMPFNADHQQYCPHDENWIGFAHEGDISHSLDRVWGLNRFETAGKPVRLWDERADVSGVLFAGHERWVFHRSGALVVGFPSSPGRPRGLYFVDAISRHTEVVSASSYDWHCNISRDGKWAVVDTVAPPSRPREPDGRRISDIVLVEMSTGRRQWVARSHPDAMHPWHPHPHFTPDGRYLVYNDFEHDGRGKASRTVVVEITALL